MATDTSIPKKRFQMVPYYALVRCCFLPIFLRVLMIANAKCAHAQPKLEILHQWKLADFNYPSTQARDTALRTGKYVPENCLILDVDVWQNPPEIRERIFSVDNDGRASNYHRHYYEDTDTWNKSPQRRIFVTLPRFKNGVPVTLATVTSFRRGDTTLLSPFPSWTAQREDNCEAGITSVYRTKIDKCGVLWVLDSGRVENFSPNPRKLCQPKVLAYDLNNGDKLVGKYQIPYNVLDQDSLLVTIAVDTRDEFCSNPFLYIADVTAFKLIVFDVKKNRCWRIGSNYFYPFPLYGRFNVADTTFNLMDGLLALTIGPLRNGDRRLYFHSLASIREGSVATSVIRNQSLFAEDVDSSWDSFFISEPARSSQSASEDMTSSGIMFFGLLSEMALACWNSRMPFTTDHIHITHQDNVTMQFPSGVKIFGDTIWILTSELQNFITSTTRTNDIKYRILTGSVSDLVRGTGCEHKSASNLMHRFPSSKRLSSEAMPFDSISHSHYLSPGVNEYYTNIPTFRHRQRFLNYKNYRKVFEISKFTPFFSFYNF